MNVQTFNYVGDLVLSHEEALDINYRGLQTLAKKKFNLQTRDVDLVYKSSTAEQTEFKVYFM